MCYISHGETAKLFLVLVALLVPMCWLTPPRVGSDRERLANHLLLRVRHLDTLFAPLL